MIVGPGEGRQFTIGAQLATVKAEGGEGPAVVETRFPVGAGAPRHVHRDHDEMFYVVTGQMVVEVDGDEVVVGPGGLARADRGHPHAFRNPGPGEAVVLALYDPAPSLAYLEELGAAIAIEDAGERSAAIVELYARYETEDA